MLLSLEDIRPLLRYPGAPDRPVDLEWEGGALSRAGAEGGDDFPLVQGQPVLIDFTQSLATEAWYAGVAESYSPIGERRGFLRALKGRLIGTAHISRRNLERFRALVKAGGAARPTILMAGAATRGMGTEALYADPGVGQIGFDIYPSALTRFVADAHQIPLADACVDAVCIQAVLEHVLVPERVVAEIARVLKPGGIVYAETPFMQQVHEGAYDFTRFSELGHRWLFRGFEAIERGPIGGPGLSAYWSSRYLLRGLTRSKKASDLLSVPFALLPLLDRFVPEPHRVDGANGVYFLGRKAEAPLPLADVVPAYLGAQR